MQLCEQYDTLMTEWEKKVEKWETSGKKRSVRFDFYSDGGGGTGVNVTVSVFPFAVRTKDSKSRELFEKLFPELRTKRDQLRDQAERFNK